MNPKRLLARAAITALGLFLFTPSAAKAAPSSIATGFDTRMVSAFDAQIVPSPPTSVFTTPLHYRQGRLRIGGLPGPGHRVRIYALGNGPMCATEPARMVHARLGLRVTLGPITFADVTADCPSHLVPAAGVLVGPWDNLTACLPPAWSALDLALNNIELLYAFIVDDTSNMQAMAPGFRTAQLACPVPAAALPEGRLNAIGGNVQFVQAMDPCSPGTPFGGLPNICPATNILTDGTPFSRGKMTLRRNFVRWFIQSSPIGATLAGKTIRLLMTFRATDPATGGQLTFPDQTVLCPPVVIGAAGNGGSAHDLYTDCGLTPTNPDTNMEATDAALIDAGSGLRIAVPGLRQN